MAAGVARPGLLVGRAGRLAGGDRAASTGRRSCCGSAASPGSIGYDTLYAIQDIEDDALVGVKIVAPAGSATRRRSASRIFYALAVLLWGAAIWSVRPDWLALLALAPAALHLANQALRADPKDGELALRLFRSNRTCGLLVFLAMLVVGLSAR